MAIPPYLSQKIEEFYSNANETELLELQKRSNELVSSIRSARAQEVKVTYHLSIHKRCSGSYSGLDTFSSREVQLIDEEDFKIAEKLCKNPQNMANFWKQTVVPVRPNRASDLLFPALMNLVIKCKDLSESCFAVLGAIIWDVGTLPIRLATWLPWAWHKAHSAPVEHPLIAYLHGKGIESVDVEGCETVQQDKNLETRFLEKDGRANVLLYTKRIKDGRIEQRNGSCYQIYLTDREVAFPVRKTHSFGSQHSLDGNPI